MDYLIHEGYPAAARKFSSEANIPQRTNSESIQARVEIRNAIHTGDIQTAVEKINELSPDVSPSFFLVTVPSVARIIPEFMHHS